MDRHDEHLLGYYRNGALVATEEEAIPVALTGVLQEQVSALTLMISGAALLRKSS